MEKLSVRKWWIPVEENAKTQGILPQIGFHFLFAKQKLVKQS